MDPACFTSHSAAHSRLKMSYFSLSKRMTKMPFSFTSSIYMQIHTFISDKKIKTLLRTCPETKQECISIEAVLST